MRGAGGIVFCFALLAFFAKPALAVEWYDGGTLQKATVAEWKKATPENQLATSADFIAAANGIEDISKIKNLDAFKSRVALLQGCVNNMTAASAEDGKVADLVLVCIAEASHQ